MREFVVSIQEALTRGLKPDERYVGNESFLDECYNMRPFDGGLRPYKAGYVDPFNNGQDTSWPFPQLFAFANETLLVEEDKIYSISTGSQPWMKTELDVEEANGAADYSIVGGGGVWHGVDLKNSWYLFNGNNVLFKHGYESHIVLGSETPYRGDTNVTIRTGCEFKGRVLTGGFDSSNFWNSTWDAIFSQWQTDAAGAGVTFQTDDIDENWVAWSSIGGGDLPMWLLYDGSNPLGPSPSAEDALNRIRRNEMGWMPMPFNGRVLFMHALGDAVVVYGSNGIAVMGQMSANYAPSTFGARLLSEVGIHDRGSVAVSQDRHVFLDETGSLWTLNAELQLQELGYEQYLSPLLEEEVTAYHDPFREEFYISGSDQGFALGSNGLYRHRDRFTALVPWKGNMRGLSHNPGGGQFTVRSAPMNMGLTARKRVQNIQVAAEGADFLRGTVLFRNRRNQPFQRLKNVVANQEGVIHQYVSGTEFQAEVTGAAEEVGRLTGIDVRYQVDDKRAIRGIFQDAS